MSQSEVAQLMQQLTEEYEAGKRGLTGLAETARHEFITARMENMRECQKRLIDLVGPEQAGKLLSEMSEER